MAWRVFEVRAKDKERLERVLAGDLVSRCSIWTREASHFGWDRDTTFVLIEGPENVLQETDERILRYGRAPKTAAAIRKRILDEEDAGAEGVGRVFGQLPPQTFRPSRAERSRAMLDRATDAIETARIRFRTWWATRRTR